MKPIGQQIILITGSTDGIGKLAALELARRQARVLVHGRNAAKVETVVNEIARASSNKKVEGFTADLSSLEEVRELAAQVLNKYICLDVLINNAGAGYSDPRYSRDGFELRFAVNYLAPFLLTELLVPALRAAAPSRIINISSAGQSPINFKDIMLEKNFDSGTAYTQSKHALIMFTVMLAERLNNDRVTVNSLHPGTYLDTNMVRRSGIAPRGRPEAGADAEVFLATAPSLENTTGKYFNVTKEAMPLEQAFDETAREKLMALSLKLTGFPEKINALHGSAQK